jgi:hypothetical protein
MTATALLEHDFEEVRADKAHKGFSRDCNTVIKAKDSFVKVFVRKTSDDPEGYGIYFTTEPSLRRVMANLKEVFG